MSWYSRICYQSCVLYEGATGLLPYHCVDAVDVESSSYGCVIIRSLLLSGSSARCSARWSAGNSTRHPSGNSKIRPSGNSTRNVPGISTRAVSGTSVCEGVSGASFKLRIGELVDCSSISSGSALPYLGPDGTYFESLSLCWPSLCSLIIRRWKCTSQMSQRKRRKWKNPNIRQKHHGTWRTSSPSLKSQP